MPSSTPTRIGPVIVGTTLQSVLAATIAAGVALFVRGPLQVQGPINVTPNGTSTGAVVQVNGVTEIQAYTVPCTATGGNVKVNNGAKYDTCIMPPILTTTGAIKEVSLHTPTSPNALPMDCGFVKGRVSGTGSAFQNLGNFSTASGSIYRFATGSLRWNSADYIKCGTLTTPNSAFTGYLRVEFYDDRSE